MVSKILKDQLIQVTAITVSISHDHDLPLALGTAERYSERVLKSLCPKVEQSVTEGREGRPHAGYGCRAAMNQILICQ